MGACWEPFLQFRNLNVVGNNNENVLQFEALGLSGVIRPQHLFCSTRHSKVVTIMMAARIHSGAGSAVAPVARALCSIFAKELAVRPITLST